MLWMNEKITLIWINALETKIWIIGDLKIKERWTLLKGKQVSFVFSTELMNRWTIAIENWKTKETHKKRKHLSVTMSSFHLSIFFSSYYLFNQMILTFRVRNLLLDLKSNGFLLHKVCKQPKFISPRFHKPSSRFRLVNSIKELIN